RSLQMAKAAQVIVKKTLPRQISDACDAINVSCKRSTDKTLALFTQSDPQGTLGIFGIYKPRSKRINLGTLKFKTTPTWEFTVYDEAQLPRIKEIMESLSQKFNQTIEIILH
ncbi:hypothetical protein ACFL16_02820, partial [Patescibacteria group bacterium]